MEDMKFDMSAPAPVLARFETLGQLKPRSMFVGLLSPALRTYPPATP